MNTLSSFVILYPVIVSTVWIIGSVFFSIQQHRVPLKDLHHGKPTDLVSVLIPAHNEADTLENVVESVANIRYAKIELILINDGSQDDTLRVMHQLADKYAQRFPVKIINIQKKPGEGQCP